MVFQLVFTGFSFLFFSFLFWEEFMDESRMFSRLGMVPVMPPPCCINVLLYDCIWPRNRSLTRSHLPLESCLSISVLVALYCSFHLISLLYYPGTIPPVHHWKRRISHRAGRSSTLNPGKGPSLGPLSHLAMEKTTPQRGLTALCHWRRLRTRRVPCAVWCAVAGRGKAAPDI